MPNLNAPSGLAPVMYRNGNFWNGQARIYGVAPTDTNAYYIGDPVKIDSTNFADVNGIPFVTKATAGAAMRGAVVAVAAAIVPTGWQGGPWINPNDLTKTFRPTGAQTINYYLAVVDDPDVIFEVQEDSSGIGLAAAVTKNANLSFGAPATGVLISGAMIAGSTYATTATLNVKVLQAVQRADNTPYTAFQKWLVEINNHDFSSGTTGY